VEACCADGEIEYRYQEADIQVLIYSKFESRSFIESRDGIKTSVKPKVSTLWRTLSCVSQARKRRWLLHAFVSFTLCEKPHARIRSDAYLFNHLQSRPFASYISLT
jgi:hypothetical protein